MGRGAVLVGATVGGRIGVGGGVGVLVGVGVGVGAGLQPPRRDSTSIPMTTPRQRKELVLETVLTSIMIILTSGKEISDRQAYYSIFA